MTELQDHTEYGLWGFYAIWAVLAAGVLGSVGMAFYAIVSLILGLG